MLSGRHGTSNSYLKPLVLGLLAGALYFLVLQPTLLGWWPRPILERQALLHFVFRGYPLIVLPSVVLGVSLFQPKTKREALEMAIFFSISMLVPVPLVNYWLVGQADYYLLDSTTFILTFQGALALLASYISALISPALCRLLLWTWRRVLQ
jgi:hypothetical protein